MKPSETPITSGPAAEHVESPAEVETRQDFDAYERSLGGTPKRAPDVPPSLTPPSDLLGLLLVEQQTLTAVEEFSRAHETDDVPAQARYYSKLLPASPPSPGQQYGFDVDLDRCSGCKACVTACHSMNGLDEEETWRDVGLLVGGTSENPLVQHVTTACHHCVEPACMIGCPVDAYEKDPVTGIVRHLDDQCFGCEYCTLACPYDVPKYHSAKGIVRKCDMCSQRLAADEAPACVQACPHEAIAIRVVDVDGVREDCEVDHFLPSAPEPHITLPTTTYRTTQVFPRNTLPADYHAPRPQHAHWPLVVMLVLTQLSVGAFAVGMVLESVAADSFAGFRATHATVALLFLLVALGASTLHLGRPLYAFRAVIGLRHSWLSREIMAFGLFAGLAMTYVAACWMPVLPRPLLEVVGWSVVGSGALGVYCSVMIYVFTKREFWNFGRTGTRFVLTSILLGIAATWVTLLAMPFAGLPPLPAEADAWFARSLFVAAACKLAYDAAVLRHLLERRNAPLKRTARLMTGPLSNITCSRFACGLIGGVLLPLVLLGQSDVAIGSLLHTTIVALSFTACLAGELLERLLFFSAAVVPRMPGSVQV